MRILCIDGDQLEAVTEDDVLNEAFIAADFERSNDPEQYHVRRIHEDDKIIIYMCTALQPGLHNVQYIGTK